MRHEDRTKEQLVNELAETHQRIAELEAMEAKSRQIEAALRRERDFAESLIETAQVIVLILDAEGRIVRFNPYMASISGYRLEEAQGKNWFDTFLPQSDKVATQDLFKQALSDVPTRGNVNPIVTKSGHERQIAWYDTTLRDTNGDTVGLLAIGHDITEHERTEKELRQKVNELTALYEASQVFLGQIDVETTLANICRLAVERFDLTMAWVGLIAEGDFDVRPAAACGFEEDYLDTIHITWDEGTTGQGPTGTAIRTAQAVAVNQIEIDPDYTPWRSEAMARGYRSSASLPLCHGSEVLGVLNVYSTEIEHFTADRLQVLQSFANLAAVALDNARLYVEAGQRAKHLATLHELDQAVTASLHIDDVYDAFARHTARLLPYACMSIILLEGGDLRVTYLTAMSPTGMSPGTILPRETSGTGWVVAQGQPLLRNNIATDVHFFEDEQLAAAGIGSYMVIPLQIKGQVFGTWNLCHRQPDGYGPGDLAIAQSMADQLAIAIENARLFEEVRTSRERLQILSRRLLDVQETERRHIARELHDEVGQVLTGLKLLVETSRSLPAASISSRLDQALALVDELATQVQELSLNLRPAMLDDLGLLPTLAWHFNRYTDQTNVRVNFGYIGPERRLAPEIETAAYRIVQEALTNVARHAGVGDVTVQLWLQEDALRVQVEDEGTGFDPQAAMATSASGGLSGMRERASLLGGQLTITSAKGSGTCLIAELPLHGPADEAEKMI